jgi:hypothetical protein
VPVLQKEKVMAQDWGGDGIFGTIGKGIREYNADSTAVSTIQSQATSFIRNYINYNAAIVIGSTYQAFSDVLEDLITAMGTDSQTVKGSIIDEGGHIFVGSATPTLAGGKFAPTQMILDDDYIRVECLVANAGADTWRLTSMRRGTVSSRATTGVAYPASDADDSVGLSFTINSPSAGTYAVGDYFYVGPTYNNEQAIIQTYFRDAIGRILPSVLDGSETIPDSLAQDNSSPTS